MAAGYGQIIRQISIFERLDDTTCERIAGCVKARRYDEGEVLFEHGDPGDELFMVVDGLIKLYLRDGQEEALIHCCDDGDILGEMALITGEPRSASAAAMVPSRVLVLDRQAFDEHLATDAAAMLEIARVLAHRQVAEAVEVARLRTQTGSGAPKNHQALKIEIDQAAREQQVQQICAADFFEELEARAQKLRSGHHAGARTGRGDRRGR